jgi:hypothetical protein
MGKVYSRRPKWEVLSVAGATSFTVIRFTLDMLKIDTLKASVGDGEHYFGNNLPYVQHRRTSKNHTP